MFKKLTYIFLFFSAALLTACEKETPSKIRLGIDAWSGSSPFFIARAIGELDSDRVKLVQLRDGVQALDAFKNGYVDATTLSIDSMIELAASDIDFEVVLIMDVSNGGDGIVGDKDIKTLEDLKGKKLGFQFHPLYRYVLERALESSTLTVDDIELVNIPLYRSVEQLEMGNVDAILTSQPFISNLVEKGSNLLFSSKAMPGEIIDAVVIHPNLSAADKQSVQYMVNAWYKGIDYLAKYPDPAYEIMSDLTDSTPRNNREQIKSIIFPNPCESLIMVEGPNSDLIQNFKAMESTLVSLGYFKGPSAKKIIVDPQYMENSLGSEK